MQLIGMLDSPYVRRVAISFQLLGLPFEHRSISVFRGQAEFSKITPVLKAPSLVCDDGSVLMDSTLMLDYGEALAAGRRSLMPAALPERLRTLRLIGLALAGCEKAVQIVYERNVRPPEKLHRPWVERVTTQLLAAFEGLERELAHAPLAATRAAIDQAGVTAAVVWRFTREALPEIVSAANHPVLDGFARQAEALPEFIAAPHGDQTYRA